MCRWLLGDICSDTPLAHGCSCLEVGHGRICWRRVCWGHDGWGPVVEVDDEEHHGVVEEVVTVSVWSSWFCGVEAVVGLFEFVGETCWSLGFFVSWKV